jgi:nucleotide-binding universal stress UspA family protein
MSTPMAPTGSGQDRDLPPEPEPHPSGGDDPPVRAVIVGVDGSECGLAAVRWAAEEAQRRNAPLRIVHAAPYLGRSDEGSPSPELPRARRITAQAYTVARHTAAGVQARTEIVPDDPARALLAEAPDAQLVVLGIVTTGAADELVLASVAQKVVSRSTTPVAVVPRSRASEPAGRPVVAVLGLGDPDDDEPAIAFAADAARRSGVPLAVVRAHGRRSGGADADWAQRLPGVDVAVREVQGGTPGDLLRAIGAAPLVVVSAGRGSLLHRSMDGTHRYLLRHCTSPMALVPPADRAESSASEESIALL